MRDPHGQPLDRTACSAGFLHSLDRGQLVSGRVLQVVPPDAVRLAVGSGVVWARACGGVPEVGTQRFEVVVPGPYPRLRLLEPTADNERGIDLLLDPSREKAAQVRGRQLDQSA